MEILIGITILTLALIIQVARHKFFKKQNTQKEGYQDLAFAKPEMGQHVIIEFSVNDMFDKRDGHDSKKTLKKLIQACLEGTNWRLMTEGISYRLGILTGRLKGYEREEDLAKLFIKD